MHVRGCQWLRVWVRERQRNVRLQVGSRHLRRSANDKPSFRPVLAHMDSRSQWSRAHSEAVQLGPCHIAGTRCGQRYTKLALRWEPMRGAVASISLESHFAHLHQKPIQAQKRTFIERRVRCKSRNGVNRSAMDRGPHRQRIWTLQRLGGLAHVQRILRTRHECLGIVTASHEKRVRKDLDDSSQGVLDPTAKSASSLRAPQNFAMGRTFFPLQGERVHKICQRRDRHSSCQRNIYSRFRTCQLFMRRGQLGLRTVYPRDIRRRHHLRSHQLLPSLCNHTIARWASQMLGARLLQTPTRLVTTLHSVLSPSVSEVVMFT